MGVLGTLLLHPEEIPSLVKLKLQMMHVKTQIPRDDDDARFCYDMLQRVSRSFALVIQQLQPELRNAICVFYLVLRALDTIEDDMSIDVATKLPLLKAMHKNIHDTSWHFSCGEKNYKVLMDKFHHVSAAFLRLGRRYRDAIKEATDEMGNGMAKFICKEVETIEDYNEYCHYVAGLVGIGLSKLFFVSKFEDLAPEILSNSMGLFLQKTNIIRDYLEDINELPKPRMFWPRDIWGKYASNLEEFKAEKNSEIAVACLNEMITNALGHVIDCLKYMSALRDPVIFRFCAIPQVMAISTLAECYNNIEVFRRVVKIRRGLTARIMDRTRNMDDVYEAFFDFSSLLANKVNKNDAFATLTLDRITAIQEICHISCKLSKRSLYMESRRGEDVLLGIALLILFLAMLYSIQK